MNEGHPAEENQGVFSRLFNKISGKRKHEEDLTEEEIMDMVNEGHEQGVLKENEAAMINNIFEFGGKQAHDVMTHRKSIVGIDCECTVKEAFDIVLSENYSRYPVYDGDIDNIIGILHIRDLLKIYVNEELREKKLTEVKEQLLFEAYCIPETRNISLLFKEMQSKKIHFAIVVDEYGQITGIVTMEDILEEIVGNILDEYDEEEELIVQNQNGGYIIDGQTSLEDIEELLGINFGCEEIDTLNGYMIYKLGKIPDDDEKFETTCDGYSFKIISAKNKMIDKVDVNRIDNKSDKEGEALTDNK